MLIKTISSSDKNFKLELKKNVNNDSQSNDEVVRTVNAIINDVKINGDKALLEYTKKI
jgi:Histidinol dehydrogenase